MALPPEAWEGFVAVLVVVAVAVLMDLMAVSATALRR
jgi:hypothetical protein